MNQSASRTPDSELSQFRVTGEIPVPALINGLTAAAVPLLLFYAWRSTQQADPFTAPWLFSFAVLLAINAVIFVFSGQKTLQRRVFIVLITALFTFLAIQAVEDGSAIIWLFAYPPIIFYISEARIGIIACLGGWLAVLLLFSPLGDALFELPYSGTLRLTMIIVLAFEMVTCYILDQSRRRSKLGLIKLAKEFEYAAKHDALTGLANRREGLEQLDAEYQRYLRNGRHYSVLLMDIDLFKQVNDTFGHQVGDDMIVLVGKTLTEQCRKVDTIARWGGEEFLILLPETSSEDAQASAERIRLAVAARTVQADGMDIGATISIGVATIQGSESIDRLLQRADEALYQAKSEGRNRTCRAAGS
ncbi:GGDEF domain-containing protein [Marinobacter halophilus]|uniref:diguanylate cyclase n=1 Tax=Marinobacter halophilus TaxID=1323740 RepID=A0A2T1KBN4_9GAMM|nr:GGDEF domain-containing protein [Marinobacter halophilus]PSF07537.1 GGDEF domain-containing protein [Marinobacter halophilus]